MIGKHTGVRECLGEKHTSAFTIHGSCVVFVEAGGKSDESGKFKFLLQSQYISCARIGYRSSREKRLRRN